MFTVDENKDLLFPLRISPLTSEMQIYTVLNTIIREWYLDKDFGLYVPGMNKSKFSVPRFTTSLKNTISAVNTITLVGEIEVTTSDYEVIASFSYTDNLTNFDDIKRITINLPFNMGGYLSNNMFSISG
jgi:hypothetical protein